MGTKSGLVGYDGDAFCHLEGTEVLLEREISALLSDRRGWLWIGTVDGRLYIHKEGELELVEEISDPEGVTITDLTEDPKGRIWFGFRYGTGFGCYEEGQIHLYRPEVGEIYPSKIGALEVDRQGNVWLGSTSAGTWDGLCYYDGISFEKIDGVSGSAILALCEAQEGDLWIGTSEGLIASDLEN